MAPFFAAMVVLLLLVAFVPALSTRPAQPRVRSGAEPMDAPGVFLTCRTLLVPARQPAGQARQGTGTLCRRPADRPRRMRCRRMRSRPRAKRPTLSWPAWRRGPDGRWSAFASTRSTPRRGMRRPRRRLGWPAAGGFRGAAQGRGGARRGDRPGAAPHGTADGDRRDGARASTTSRRSRPSSGAAARWASAVPTTASNWACR